MRVLIPALTALALAGCAGPQAPFDIGTQAAPVGLVLGEHTAVVVAPVGPISAPLPPSLAPFLPTQPNVRPPSAAPLPSLPPLGPCPDFDPLAPVASTGITLPGPPQPATYTYRASTTDTLGSKKASYKGNSTWKTTVSAPDATTGGYTVTTDVSIGKTTTQRVLLVLPKAVTSGKGGDNPLDAPDATDPNAQVIDLYNSVLGGSGFPPIPRSAPNVGRYGPAGIYLVSQSAGTSVFKPTTPIPLLQTPVGNNSFTGIGTDGSTNMQFTSTVVKKALVNACGKKLESVEVALTAGKIIGRTTDNKVQSVDFTETLDFGLQFGGLPLRDRGKVTGTTLPGGAIAPDAIERTFDFTINSAPKPART
jgi:hypothetical protein